jgi:hypothetical protein
MRYLSMIPCKYFYRLRVNTVELPETLQRNTRLPGDPKGDPRTGYSLRRRELLFFAKQDREQGGHPLIEKVPVVPRAINCNLEAARS